MIEMKVDRPNNLGFTCYFPTIIDLRNYELFLETIIENAKKEKE